MDAFTTQCNCANAKDRELKHGGIARMQGIVRSNQSGGVDGWHVKTFRRCKKARNRNAKSTKLSQPMVHEDTQNLQDARKLNAKVTKMSQSLVIRWLFISDCWSFVCYSLVIHKLFLVIRWLFVGYALVIHR